MISYPPGELTPNGARRLLEGKEPHISYVSYDDSAVFHLMGPMAPAAGVQEGVTIGRESIKGLIPNWKLLDQAGANQDGVTFNDAIYEAAEIDMVVEAQGVTPAGTRKVIRDWVAAWDSKQQGELHVFTPEQGLWWAPVRWLKAPGEALMRAQANRQRFIWSARIDDAFWRSYDSVGVFEFAYEDMTETFNFTAGSLTATTLGTNWPLRYDQPPNADRGNIYADGSQARWRDGTAYFSREVVAGPYKDFSTDTDNQVINIVLGTIPEVSLPKSAFNDIWGRMGRNTDGTWNGNGIRARFGFGYVSLHRFNNFGPTLLAERFLVIPPLLGDKWTLLCGFEGDTRLFKVLRNGFDTLAFKEEGTGSVLNSTHRGIGFGMSAALAILTQATPASVRKISSGDNSTVSQSGYASLTNTGDVEAWPRYLLYGPGMFNIGNGPDSSDTVQFGPLLDGQIVLIETEPRRRSVVDLTPDTVSTAQELNVFQQLIKALVSFASNNNVPPLLQQFESLFGILPPQGNLYSYLTGRFTKAVPAKSPGSEPTTSQIFIKIDDGNANSKVVAALTPRRRWPL